MQHNFDDLYGAVSARQASSTEQRLRASSARPAARSRAPLRRGLSLDLLTVIDAAFILITAVFGLWAVFSWPTLSQAVLTMLIQVADMGVTLIFIGLVLLFVYFTLRRVLRRLRI